MELIILFGAVVALFASLATAGLVATGRHRHTRAGLAAGKTMASGAAVIVIIGGLALFGLSALLAAWPFFVVAGVALWLFFLWYERGIKEARPTWDARRAELENRGPLPPWAQEIERHRRR